MILGTNECRAWSFWWHHEDTVIELNILAADTLPEVERGIIMIVDLSLNLVHHLNKDIEIEMFMTTKRVNGIFDYSSNMHGFQHKFHYIVKYFTYCRNFSLDASGFCVFDL